MNVHEYQAKALFRSYGVAVPGTLDELTEAAVAIQEAVRADGTEDFYGIAMRGAPNCGLNFWMVGSTWGPSFGARWYDDEGRPTLDTPEPAPGKALAILARPAGAIDYGRSSDGLPRLAESGDCGP